MTTVSMSTELSVLDAQSRLSADYLRLIESHPVLCEQDEHELAVDLYENNNLQAAQRLVFSNLRGVVYVARNYQGYGLPLMDMVQEGTIGLMKAVKAYNPYQKVRLFTYALPWIKSEIQQFVMKNWKLVKAATTDAKKKLFFNLRSLKQKLLPMDTSYIEAISKDLNVPVADVVEMDAYMSEGDVSTEALMDLEGEESPETALIAQQDVQMQQRMLKALDFLPAREKKIIESRFLQEPSKTYQSLADEFGVSLERVRQLEKQAILLMRKQLV